MGSSSKEVNNQRHETSHHIKWVCSITFEACCAGSNPFHVQRPTLGTLNCRNSTVLDSSNWNKHKKLHSPFVHWHKSNRHTTPLLWTCFPLREWHQQRASSKAILSDTLISYHLCSYYFLSNCYISSVQFSSSFWSFLESQSLYFQLSKQSDILHIYWVFTKSGACVYLDEGAIMQRSLGHWHSFVSCSIPKLCPISCATVVATNPTTLLWSMLTPPENSKVQMGPFRALPTTPPSNCIRL